jgi:hypothetical protein
MVLRGYLPSSVGAGVMVDAFSSPDDEGLSEETLHFLEGAMHTFFFLFGGCFPREFETMFSSS